MNKKLRQLSTRQSLFDFTNRLGEKWKLITTPSEVQQPGKKDGLEEILRQLVALPTVSGMAANHDGLDYIERYLKDRGMLTKRFEQRGIESIVATTYETKTPKIMLSAHLDVVPAPADMFELREKDGIYYGRGVYDMKFAIAVYMAVIDEIKNNIGDYDLGIMITTDEEAGGLDGVGMLVEKGYIPEVFIVPDGGDNWQIQLSSKGFLYLSVSAKGKPAHSSRPWLGDNAILKLLPVIPKIRALLPETIAPDTSTFNVGMINGGHAVNQVADYAEVSIDIRTIRNEERDRLLNEIRKVCEQEGVDVQVVQQGDGTSFSLDEPYTKAFANIITEVTGVTVKGTHTLGGNDTRFYNPYKIPCISLYPPGRDHHGPEEQISKEAVFQFKEIIRRYLDQVAKQNSAAPVDKQAAKV